MDTQIGLLTLKSPFLDVFHITYYQEELPNANKVIFMLTQFSQYKVSLSPQRESYFRQCFLSVWVPLINGRNNLNTPQNLDTI